MPMHCQGVQLACQCMSSARQMHVTACQFHANAMSMDTSTVTATGGCQKQCNVRGLSLAAPAVGNKFTLLASQPSSIGVWTPSSGLYKLPQRTFAHTASIGAPQSKTWRLSGTFYVQPGHAEEATCTREVSKHMTENRRQ